MQTSPIHNRLNRNKKNCMGSKYSVQERKVCWRLIKVQSSKSRIRHTQGPQWATATNILLKPMSYVLDKVRTTVAGVAGCARSINHSCLIISSG